MTPVKTTVTASQMILVIIGRSKCTQILINTNTIYFILEITQNWKSKIIVLVLVLSLSKFLRLNKICYSFKKSFNFVLDLKKFHFPSVIGLSSVLSNN